MNALRLFLRQGVNAPLRLQDGLANFETGDSGKVSGRCRYDTPPTWTNVDRWPDSDAKQCVWMIFQRLASIQPEHIAEPGSSAFEQEPPPGIRFAPSAQDIFD